MDKIEEDIHVFFLPYISPGHLLPMVDMALLFSSRGVKSTIVTTNLAADRIQNTVDLANERQGLNRNIRILRIPFPSWAQSVEIDTVSGTAALPRDLQVSLNALQRPFDELLVEHCPDCIVSDNFFTWSVESASRVGIPRFVFRGNGAFSLKLMEQVVDCMPQNGIEGDDGAFVVPGLRHRIEMRKSHLPPFLKSTDISMMKQLYKSVFESYGAVSNTFEELEKDYIAVREAEEGVTKVRTWHIGPFFLSNRKDEMKVRGGLIDDSKGVDCLRWLDSKKPNSVFYVCFGSCGKFTNEQLKELAVGLESCGHPFIWVVKDTGVKDSDHWAPEEKTDDNGMIMVGWVPQRLIIKHKSVGGFLTHCGWNSILESISAGLPMVTWPLFGDHFFNERTVVDVLRIGVGMGGALKCSDKEEERGFVRRSEIVKAVDSVMGCGDEAKEMRKRAKDFSVMAARAVEEGGSSHSNVGSLLKELRKLKVEKRKQEKKEEGETIMVGESNDKT